MHETAAAQSIIQIVEAEADKLHKRPIRVRISCGALNAVNDEVMRFAFEAVGKGTITEGAALEIRHVPLNGRCRACGERFEFDLDAAACTRCGGHEYTLEPDAALTLDEIEFEDDAA